MTVKELKKVGYDFANIMIYDKNLYSNDDMIFNGRMQDIPDDLLNYEVYFLACSAVIEKTLVITINRSGFIY